jgi:hypothetical protein
MTIKLALGLAVAAIALGGCVIVDADVKEDWDSARKGGFDLVYGAEVTVFGPEPSVTITAHSNGCTNETQFSPTVTNTGDQWRVGFRRTTEDRCRALVPEGKKLTWSFAQLGIPNGVQVRVANPVGR